MVRRYAMKAGKKRKQREERYDREEEVEEEVAEQPVEDEAIAKKAMTERTSDGEEEVNELEGIPIDPSDLKVANKPKVIFILERASLEVAKVGKVFNL